jgi:hypothetical protein
MHVLAVPGHRGAQTLVEWHALAPAQNLKFGDIDAIIIIIEGMVSNPSQAVAKISLGAIAV